MPLCGPLGGTGRIMARRHNTRAAQTRCWLALCTLHVALAAGQVEHLRLWPTRTAAGASANLKLEFGKQSGELAVLPSDATHLVAQQTWSSELAAPLSGKPWVSAPRAYNTKVDREITAVVLRRDRRGVRMTAELRGAAVCGSSPSTRKTVPAPPPSLRMQTHSLPHMCGHADD